MLTKIFKYTVLLGFAIVLGFPAIAQVSVPKGLNYQAVARDDDGYPMSGEVIDVEVSVLAGDDCDSLPGGCEVKWVESHVITTNEFGFFSFVIGEGVLLQSYGITDFGEFDWKADGDYWVRVRADFGQDQRGNLLEEFGTLKLQSVPYALIADYALNVPDAKLSIFQLTDVEIDTTQFALKSGTTIKWDNGIKKWIPVQLEGQFITADGSTDLTNDWTITSDDLILNGGTLKASSVQTNSLAFKNDTNLNIKTLDTIIVADADHKSIPTTKAVYKHVDEIFNNTTIWEKQNRVIYPHNYNLGLKFGFGLNEPKDRFHVDVATEGFVVTGDFNSAEAIEPAADSSMMAYYPARAAIRAGMGTYGDIPDEVGLFSAGFGYRTKASGDYSFAFGNRASATGTGSVSFGLNNITTGKHAFSTGRENSADGFYSFASGDGNTVKGLTSHAMGIDNEVFGTSSIAMGNSNVIGALNRQDMNSTLVVGTQNESWSSNSIAVGQQCKTGASDELAGNGSAAIGFQCQTKGDYSLAAGLNLRINSIGQVAFGRYNAYDGVNDNKTSWVGSDPLFVIGNGTGVLDRRNALSVWKDGTMAVGFSGAYATAKSYKLSVEGQIYCQDVIKFSDKRFKKDIQPLGSVLDRLTKLEGVYYYWDKKAFPNRSFTDGREIGLIAQEVEKQFPELVSTGDDGYKALEYSKLTAVLLEAIKEQQQVIDQLKKENQELKNVNATNDNNIKDLNEKYSSVNKRLEMIESLLKASAQR